MTNKKNIKKKILVVEDRENWRATFCNLLDNMGYEVFQATCGADFKNAAVNADVIILDISMQMSIDDKEEDKTAGLKVLIHLQQEYPDHPAIQNPIIRSMWDRTVFEGTEYENVKVAIDRWCSRNVTTAELLEHVESTPGVDDSGRIK